MILLKRFFDGAKNDLGKALIVENGCSILKINNDV